MQIQRYNAVRARGDVISDILNCVCPECGGRMGEPGQEFKCRGECLTDWRPVWERALSVGFSAALNRNGSRVSFRQFPKE
jgi:tRNA(Ile2) C34 agmatinyltransferase TiaS